MSVFSFRDLAFMGVATSATGPYTVTDANAIAYIAAVEAADGQELESGVRQAIDQFVIGCKADGIWSAIKASCLLAGARTLTGALVPLVGTAPTNINFVSGDYNRKTGLVGNGSNKSLNVNRAGNADPRNSAHGACYRTTTEGTPVNLFGGITDPGTRNTQCYFTSGRWYFAARKGYVGDPNYLLASTLTGFFGVNRSSSTAHSTRINATSFSQTINSVAPTTELTAVFTASYNGSLSLPAGHSSVRLSFYSFGESLNLALLDARVTTLVNAIAAAIP